MNTKAFICNEAQQRMTESMKHAGINFMGMGYANGYVTVPPEHPLHGLSDSRVNHVADISVWGGITLACSKGEFMPPASKSEMIDCDGTPDDIPQDWWVFGFDTMHWNDGPHHSREWCIRETKRLQAQLDAVAEKQGTNKTITDYA